MRWIFISVWVIAVICVTGFVWFMKTPTTSQYTYYTSVISDADSTDTVSVFGKVQIEKETMLLPTEEGNVTQVLVKAGERIKKNQVLATLDYKQQDLEDYQKLEMLTQDSGQVEKLNKMMAEITQLEKKGFYDALEASKRRSEVYSAISQFMNYKTGLKKLFDQTRGKIIVAPFDGIVTDVRLREGQRITLRDEKQDISISMAPADYQLSVELEVGDELLHKIKKDNYFSVNLPLNHDVYVEGQIKAISHQVYDDKKKRFFKVIGELQPKPEMKQKLASGMKVMVNVQTQVDDNWTWIPKAAFDIHIEDALVSSTLNFTGVSRGIASSRAVDFKRDPNTGLDEQKNTSAAANSVSNQIFPAESNQTEVYLLSLNNRVIKANVTKVSESGEMVAIQGKDLKGMRVITHYVPKETPW